MSFISNQVQLNFIEKIKDALPEKISLVDTLADILAISNDSAYRRIRGNTSMTIDELSKICNHLRINFDMLNEDREGMVTFQYMALSNHEQQFEEYLRGLLQSLKMISTYTDKKIVYAAEDIPPFHHFRFPELTAFKIFYWKKAILDDEYLKGKNFDFNIIGKGLISLGRQLHDIYMRIPTEEIWTEDTVSSTLKQVEFYFDSGVVNKKDALVILQQIVMMIDDLKQMAMQSSKISQGGENNFKMYSCDVMIGNNSILLYADGKRTVFKSFNTFNNLATSNIPFCDETERWMNNLMKKSTIISGSSEKTRNQLFRKALERVNALSKKIEAWEE